MHLAEERTRVVPLQRWTLSQKSTVLGFKIVFEEDSIMTTPPFPPPHLCILSGRRPHRRSHYPGKDSKSADPQDVCVTQRHPSQVRGPPPLPISACVLRGPTCLSEEPIAGDIATHFVPVSAEEFGPRCVLPKAMKARRIARPSLRRTPTTEAGSKQSLSSLTEILCCWRGSVVSLYLTGEESYPRP